MRTSVINILILNYSYTQNEAEAIVTRRVAILHRGVQSSIEAKIVAQRMYFAEMDNWPLERQE